MKTKEAEGASDLEDGEIREDVLEDISDCSISEIVTMKKDLEDEEDPDIELLREEALKSMQNIEGGENEEELEEELCRLEALKSLLKNMELSENQVTPIKEIACKRRPTKKRKRKSKCKRKKLNDSKLSAQSLLPTQIMIENKNTLNRLNVTLPSRSWYPKADLTLIDNSLVDQDEGNDVKSADVKSALVLHSVNAVRESTSYNRQNSVSKNRIVKNNTYKPPLMKANNFKKVTKHCIRKFDSTLPVNRVLKFTPQNSIKKGQYKLVNKSNYVINKLPVSKINHPLSRSLFSLNRLKCPQVTIDPKQFIIDLDDEDSSREEDTPESCARLVPACDKANRDEVSITEQSSQRESKLLSNSLSTDEIVANQVKIQPESAASLKPILVDNVKEESLVEEDKTKCPDRETKSDEIDGEQKDMSVLVEAEAYLIKIREKLVYDLDELDKTLKQDAIEHEKLNALSKKLSILKSMVTKIEAKIKLQQLRLSANGACLNCLFNGVQTRTVTCSKFEEVCRTVGKNLLGSLYKPPHQLESVIVEKRRRIDFSKRKLADLK